MPLPDYIRLFIQPINNLDIRYCIIGATAVVVYGEPRMTHDIGLVIKMVRYDINALRNTFQKPEYYCPPEEVIQLEICHPVRGHFNLIHLETGMKADIYPVGKDPLHLWAMDNRRGYEYEQIHLWIAPPTRYTLQ